MTWSPLNRIPLSVNAKQRWFEVCPGVWTASKRQPLPATRSPSRNRDIGNEVPVAAFLDPGVAALPTGMRTETVGRRTGRRLQRLRRRRMVAMGVGDQDMGHPLAREAGEQCLDMLGEVGTGVDHRDLAAADDVGSGTPEGERARIARDDAADPRCDRLEPAVFERELAAKRDVDGHRGRLHEIARLPQGVGVISFAAEGGWVAMKIKLDIDCTPDEVREFFGLPQVKPLQEELLKEVQQRLSANIKAMDPEAMLKTWLPATLKGFEQLQEMFLARMGGAAGKRK